MEYRVFPSSFDPTDPNMRTVQQPIDWVWESCEAVLKRFSKKGVMMRLPLFWQLEAPLFFACRAANTFIFVNEPANMPLGALATRDAEIDTVITDYVDASAFSAYLAEHRFALPPFWIIIDASSTPPQKLPQHLSENSVRIARELHRSPGVPVFVQCTTLVEQNIPSFHATDAYQPHVDTALVRTKDSCTCGKELFRSHIE